MARSASAVSWGDLCAENDVHVLSEVDGQYFETSLKKFREIEKNVQTT